MGVGGGGGGGRGRERERDSEMLCLMESHLLLKKFPPPVVTEPGTIRSTGQGLTHLHSVQKG